jgi:hypothetical protein
MHQRFLKKLKGETVIKFPTKVAPCFKYFGAQKRLREAQIMPAMVRFDSVKTAMRPGRQWPLSARMLSVGSRQWMTATGRHYQFKP